MTEFCPNCGNARTGAFRFCRSCGFDFDGRPEVEAEPDSSEASRGEDELILPATERVVLPPSPVVQASPRPIDPMPPANAVPAEGSENRMTEVRGWFAGRSWELRVALPLLLLGFLVAVFSTSLGAAILLAGLTFVLIRLTEIVWTRSKARYGRIGAGAAAAVPGFLAVLFAATTVVGAGQATGLVAAPTASPSQAAVTVPTASPTSVTETASPVLSASPTATPTPTVTATPTASPTPAPTVDPTPVPTPDPTPAPTPAPAAAPTPVLDFKPVKLAGRGDKVVRFRIPEEAAAIAVVKYTGSSNFAVWTVDESGSESDLLVNTIGRYTGRVLFDERDHSVAFKVTSSGSWTITVNPIQLAPSWGGAKTLTGSGDNVVRIIANLDPLATLKLTHRGSGNFAVWAYGGDSGTDLLVNEIGRYSGEVFLGGATLLEITADGSWSATLVN
jgi:hypothetical protein